MAKVKIDVLPHLCEVVLTAFPDIQRLGIMIETERNVFLIFPLEECAHKGMHEFSCSFNMTERAQLENNCCLSA